MSKTRFTPWVVLACIGTLAGCTSGEDGTAGNTQLNIVLPNGAPGNDLTPPDGNNGSTAPAAFDIQVVEYTIACDDGDPAPNGPFLDNGAGFDDRVVISGVLEVFDSALPGRTNPGGPLDFGKNLGEIYVAQGFMDLPVTQKCSAQLRARDADNEVICSDTVSFNVEADKITTVNVLMYCGLSFQAPVAQLDLAADFSFNVSNFCPDAFVLNCIDSAIDVQTIPGLGDIAVTACQSRFRDGDSQCGDSCDPQDCALAPEGLRCAPKCQGDPLIIPNDPSDDTCPTEPTTTVKCAGGASAIDCDGFPNLDPATGLPLPPDTECVFNGDTLGAVGGPAPGPPPALGGPGPGPGGFFVTCAICDASYIFLTQGMDPRCTVPTGLPVTPGAVVTCSAVTTDGDKDCNKTKTVDLTCPGLSACQEATAPDCADTSGQTHPDCVAGTCNDSSGIAVCEYDPTNVGGACGSAPAGGLGRCNDAGVCEDFGCASDADCENPATECMVAPPNACDTGTGLCAAEVPGNDGGTCNTGTGSGDGTCAGGTCVSNDTCAVAGDCGDGLQCTEDVCSGVPLVCSNPNSPFGTSCDAGGGPGSGACDGAGACVAPPTIDPVTGDTAWRALPRNCQTGWFEFIDGPDPDSPNYPADARVGCDLCLSGSCDSGTQKGRACDVDGDCPGGTCTVGSTPDPPDCELDCFTFNCEILTEPEFNIPLGGQAVYPTGGGRVANAAVRGCEVVSGTLKNQLAIDTEVFLNATADDTSNLTITYDVVAGNAGLALAAPLANLRDVTITTTLTSANPSFIESKLDPDLQGTSVGAYIKPVGAGATGFVLTPSDVPPVTQLVVPTSFPNVLVNFDPAAILIELVIVSSGAPLNITGDSCTFNNPTGTCVGGLNAFEECDPTIGDPGDTLCLASNPITPPGTCVRTDGAAITIGSTP